MRIIFASKVGTRGELKARSSSLAEGAYEKKKKGRRRRRGEKGTREERTEKERERERERETEMSLMMLSVEGEATMKTTLRTSCREC